jgi:hypothetical protein
MNKLVCVDSQIFIWGIKKQSLPTQADMIPKAIKLIDWLIDNEYKLLLPVPLLTEVLSPVPVNEQHLVLSLIDKKFQIAPFDNIAAYKCSELIYNSLKQQELVEYREQHLVTKNKIKFDCMIAAIAITRKAACIYSEDPDIKKFAGGHITISSLPLLGNQTDLFGNLV